MHDQPQHSRPAGAFTLVEILISILILALGVLGLGALFPVIIREQRLGTDASAGVSVSNSARALLTQTQWGGGFKSSGSGAHPAIGLGGRGATNLLWTLLRDGNAVADQANWTYPIRKGLGQGWRDSSPNNFQPYGQGEWYATVVNLSTGALQLGYPDATSNVAGLTGNGKTYFGTAQDNGWVDVPVSARLFPTSGAEPQYIWDAVFQRVTNFEHAHWPGDDAVRAAIFVRRIDPRIRLTGNAKTLSDALLANSTSPEFRFPVGETQNAVDPLIADATLDGTGQYSAIKTCEVEFFYQPSNPAMTYRDRLYIPTAWARPGGAPNASDMAKVWGQLKQPGQKLVDNLGNIYTVVGSGNEPGITAAQTFDGVAGADYLKVDPPIPESVTAERASPAAAGEISNYLNTSSPYARRAIRQVAFTPQIPISVTLVEVAKGSGQ